MVVNSTNHHFQAQSGQKAQNLWNGYGLSDNLKDNMVCVSKSHWDTQKESTDIGYLLSIVLYFSFKKPSLFVATYFQGMRIFKYIFYLFVYWYKLGSIQFNAEERSLFKSKETLLVSFLQTALCQMIGLTCKHSSIFKSSRHIQLKYRKLENLKQRY